MRKILFVTEMMIVFLFGVLVADMYYDNKESKYKYDATTEIEAECHKYKLVYDKVEGLCK